MTVKSQEPGPSSCSQEDCARPMHSRGMCQAHYRKFMKYGTAQPTPEMKKKPGPAPDPSKWRSRHNTSNPNRARTKKEPRPETTHCSKGHELTEDNVYLNSSTGVKACRACRIEAVRRYRKGNPVPSDTRFGAANRNKTHCPQGHPYDEENTYITSQGTRACRACRRVSVHRQKLSKYGIEQEDFDRLLKDQEGMCGICGELFSDKRVPHIDHCHITGDVRGLLCSRCNTGLGQFLDNAEILYQAIDYVTRNKIISA